MASYCNLCELRSLIHTNRSSKYDTSYIYWSTDFRWKHLKIEQTKHERLHKHKHRSMAEKNKLNIIYLEGGRPNRWNGLQRTIRRCKINTQEQEKIALFRFDCLFFFFLLTAVLFHISADDIFCFFIFSASYNLCLCVCIDDVNWLIWLFNSHRWQPYTAYKSVCARRTAPMRHHIARYACKFSSHNLRTNKSERTENKRIPRLHSSRVNMDIYIHLRHTCKDVEQ